MYTIIPLIGIISAVISLMFSISIYGDKRYKQGQIDALNGKIKYERKENENREIIWIEKINNN